MREIKFRIWMKHKENSDNGWMSFFTLVPEKLPSLLLVGNSCVNNHYFRNYIQEERVEFSIMQYTGLKDKNGKEIYEGDIVKIDGEKIVIRYEEMNNCGCCFDDAGIGFNFTYNQGTKSAEKQEVIGNIYENPNLLTGA